MAYHRQHGVDTRIVRIFNTYGARMDLNDGRALPNMLKQALLGQALTVYGDGKQTRSFCYVDDLVEGIVRLLHSAEHLPINIGNPDEMTLLEFASRINTAVSNPGGITFVPKRAVNVIRSAGNRYHSSQKLNWEPVASKRA
jgi:dTDP-glucose 4,6-dehydratase